MQDGTHTPDSRHAASLAEAARIAAIAAEHAAEHDRDGSFPTEATAAIADSPLNTILLDGSPWTTFGPVLATLSRGDASFGTAWLMHQGTGKAGASVADPEQRALLEAAFRGGAWFSNALSEPTSGNLFLLPQQDAARVDGGWRLSGAKRFVSGCERASYLSVNARCDGVPRFFVIDVDDSVEIVDVWDTMGMRGTRSQLLTFRDTLLPDNRAVEMSVSEPNAISVGLAWISVGIAEAAMAFAIDYARERVLPPEGRALADMQWVQFAVADMSMSLEAARALAARSAQASDQRAPDMISLHVQSKTVANEAAIAIARAALEIAGGSGYFRSRPIERYLRDAMSGPLMAFSGAAVRDFLGKVLLGRGPQHD